MSQQMDKRALLHKLPPFKYVPSTVEQNRFDQINLGRLLLRHAKIDHEQEYDACRALAAHLLGKVPEPDDGDGDDA